jgi:uncharacterized membrane protein
MADLVVLAFADRPTAEGALDELQRLHDETHALTLRDWALVEREDDDHLAVVRSSDPPKTRGSVALAGGVMGTIIGGLLLAPLAGLMVGTLLGATIGRREDSGVAPAFAGDLSAALESGTAALFLYVIAHDADVAVAALAPFKPRVVRTSLDPADEAALLEHFKQAGGEADEAGPAPGPATAEPAGVLNRSFGHWYPTDFVVALAGDAPAAAAIASALEAGGFPQDEIAYRAGEQVLEQVEAFRREEGPVRGALGRVQEHLTSEGQVGRRYREAAQSGAAIVAVRAESPERVEAAARVLRANGARDIHHFGRWAIADLGSAPKSDPAAGSAAPPA